MGLRAGEDCARSGWGVDHDDVDPREPDRLRPGHSESALTAAQIDGEPSGGARLMLGHHLMVYSSVDEFITCALAFVRAGLARGDAVLVASPHAAAVADALGDA